MKLRTRLLLSTSLLVVLFILALGIAIFGMQKTKQRFEHFIDVEQAMLQYENTMYTQGLQMGQALRNIAMDPDNERAYINFDNATAVFEQANADAQRIAQIHDPETLEMMQVIVELRTRQVPLQQRIISQARAYEQAAAIETINGHETPVWREIRGLLMDSIARRTEAIDLTKSEMTTLAGQILMTSVVLALIAVLLGGGAMVWLTRSVMRQLGGEPDYAAEIARNISEGNFAATVQLRPGDKSSLMYAMHTMQQGLAQTVRDIRQSALEIDSAAAEIAAGNADLSARTESQAANLEQTASAMEELTSTVQHNADNASQGDTLASTASRVAQRGGDAVRDVVATMTSIKESSAKIEEIITVIDGIAFQTNILALNAAVEAARAGAQGRGFAVVASEVRTLAQRSAAAAQEIKELISDSVARVEEGDRQADEAGKTMAEVVASIQEVAVLMSEITAATQEQSSGIGEIGMAVGQLDSVTQQNAALVEQAAAAAASLEHQARALTHAVSRFRLADPVTIDQHVALPATRPALAQPAAG